MIINVKAKPRAIKNSIKKINDKEYQVSVTAPPLKGLANMAIRKVLCDYFDVRGSCVVLKSGYSSKIKVFEIMNK